jgi:hypothetical protein
MRGIEAITLPWQEVTTNDNVLQVQTFSGGTQKSGRMNGNNEREGEKKNI